MICNNQLNNIFVDKDYDKEVLDKVLPHTMPSPAQFSEILSSSKDYMNSFGLVAWKINQSSQRKKIKLWKIANAKEQYLDHFIEVYITDRHKVISLKNSIIKKLNPQPSKPDEAVIERGKLMLNELKKYFGYERKSSDDKTNMINAYNNKIYVFKFNSLETRMYYMNSGRSPYRISIS